MRPRRLWCIALICGIASAQDLQFETASVRYAGNSADGPASSMKGGPGTSDPIHLRWEAVPMLRLLSSAYGVDFDQITGPGWIDSELYTVLANVPAGASKDGLQKMLQRLLKERFQLSVHRIQKPFPVYELLVGKNGPKLAKSAGPRGQAVNGDFPTLGGDGFPVLARGSRHAAFQPIENGVRVTRETFRDYSMTELAQELAMPLGEPSSWRGALSTGRVVDKTGLSGKYDFRLYYAGAHYPGGAFPNPGPDGTLGGNPTLFQAVEQQLGLKLQETRAPVEVIVVDHLEKMPSSN